MENYVIKQYIWFILKSCSCYLESALALDNSTFFKGNWVKEINLWGFISNGHTTVDLVN